MDTIKPTVVTSKLASNHILKIRSEHADMLKGMQVQQQKGEMYKQQKVADQKAQEQVDMQNQQKQLENKNKQRELEIKAAALSL